MMGTFAEILLRARTALEFSHGLGHSRRFRFVRFRGIAEHEFLRQGRDGPMHTSRRAALNLGAM
jgi:hypothetical protein